MTRAELIAALEGPSRMLNGVAIAALASWLTIYAVEGRAIVIPSWVGWFGPPLAITGLLQITNGYMAMRLRLLQKRIALLKAKEAGDE